MTLKIFHAPAQPRKGLFMDIQKNNSWTFMAHWWTFMTKKTKTFMSKRTKDIYDEKQIFLTKNIFIYDFPKREAQQNARWAEPLSIHLAFPVVIILRI